MEDSGVVMSPLVKSGLAPPDFVTVDLGGSPIPRNRSIGNFDLPYVTVLKHILFFRTLKFIAISAGSNLFPRVISRLS
jgi:hypothetical protein